MTNTKRLHLKSFLALQFFLMLLSMNCHALNSLTDDGLPTPIHHQFSFSTGLGIASGLKLDIVFTFRQFEKMEWAIRTALGLTADTSLETRFEVAYFMEKWGSFTPQWYAGIGTLFQKKDGEYPLGVTTGGGFGILYPFSESVDLGTRLTINLAPPLRNMYVSLTLIDIRWLF